MPLTVLDLRLCEVSWALSMGLVGSWFFSCHQQGQELVLHFLRGGRAGAAEEEEELLS
jgi:hypothetical protein